MSVWSTGYLLTPHEHLRPKSDITNQNILISFLSVTLFPAFIAMVVLHSLVCFGLCLSSTSAIFTSYVHGTTTPLFEPSTAMHCFNLNCTLVSQVRCHSVEEGVEAEEGEESSEGEAVDSEVAEVGLVLCITSQLVCLICCYTLIDVMSPGFVRASSPQHYNILIYVNKVPVPGWSLTG